MLQVAANGHSQGIFSITLQTALGSGKVLEPALVNLVVKRTG